MSRHTMNTCELIDLAIDDLQAIREQVLWLQAQLDGRRRGGDGAGPVSTPGPSDPTGTAVVGHVHDQPGPDDLRRPLHDVIRGKLHATHRDMLWLVNERLLGWRDRVRLADEQWRPSDDEAGATLESGLSVYRGDRPGDAPGGRPDLAEAVAAQGRRLERGEGWGEA